MRSIIISFLFVWLGLLSGIANAQGSWTYLTTKVEVVPDRAETPARWVGSSTGVAAQKNWVNQVSGFNGLISASFAWSGMPSTVPEGGEYSVVLKLEQQANNETGYGVWIKAYGGEIGGVEQDGPSAEIGWREPIGQRQASGKLIAPKHSGQQMYIRILCKVAGGDYYQVCYYYTFREQEATSQDRLGSVWSVVENGVWQGTWTRRPGTLIFDAVWRRDGGAVVATDVIQVESVQGDQIVLYRQGNRGRYYATLSADGTLRGNMSWNDGGSQWTGEIR